MGRPSTDSGTEHELRTPASAARSSYAGQRSSNSRSSTTTVFPDRIACRHGPSSFWYCASSATVARLPVDATVLGLSLWSVTLTSRAPGMVCLAISVVRCSTVS
jgi:hypothetical protein